ncbi:2-C-methyl-D-erythritol 4-phosphate cytidylyltransferase [soil metagenome]
MLSAAGCRPVVMVVPTDALEEARTIAELFDRVRVTTGGDTRQRSVGNGLASIGAEVVVVHDAARPFATPQDVHDVVAALDEADAALSAVPVDETLKQVEGRRVIETVDRSTLWRALTPQAFRAVTLRDAHRRAADEGFEATDDAQLIERYGGVVTVVHGSTRNLKLTRPEDFALAEAMLSART